MLSLGPIYHSMNLLSILYKTVFYDLAYIRDHNSDKDTVLILEPLHIHDVICI